MSPDYAGVTEVPGNRLTREALSMAYSRYLFAAAFCSGNDVLEVACGAGQGLALLARSARSVIGADRMPGLLAQVPRGPSGRLPLVTLDAQALPFRGGVFDLVLLNEALYYLADPVRFWSESRRVLRTDGRVIVTTINSRWRDFSPSPHSTGYHTPSRLRHEMSAAGFAVELYGGFAVGEPRGAARAVSILKRAAGHARLIPRTMKGKAALKRLFYGRLVDAPAVIEEGMSPYDPPVPLGDRETAFKVIYAVGLVR